MDPGEILTVTDLDTAFASFAFTPAADMERSALQQRLTMKFLLPVAALAHLASELAPRYTLLRADEKRSASYRTLHFDTEDLAFFHSHRRGLRRRQKVRIRHYDDRRLSFFEVKQRFHGMKTVKQRRQRTYGDNELRAEDLALAGRHTGPHGGLFPHAWTLFRRLTLVSLLADERVTFDFDLRFSDGTREVGVPQVVIAEVKQGRLCRRSPVMLALRRMGFRPRRFSKYCMAMVTLHPDIRHNRLLPQLRAMEAIRHA
jgi:hypothetical protein